MSLPPLAAATAGCSGADLAELCRRAGMAAIREMVAAEQGGKMGGDGAEAAAALRQEHLLGALATLRRSVSARTAERYEDMEAALREGSLTEWRGDREGADAAGEEAEGRQQQGQQAQLMQQLVRATLDHTAAAKAQALQSRVELLEGMLRAAGLEVPPPQPTEPAAPPS